MLKDRCVSKIVLEEYDLQYLSQQNITIIFITLSDSLL